MGRCVFAKDLLLRIFTCIGDSFKSLFRLQSQDPSRYRLCSIAAFGRLLGIDNFFSTAAFRFGHSQIFDIVFRINDDGKESPAGHILLNEAFYFPTSVLSDGIDSILRGATIAGQATTSPAFSSALQNYLFGPPKFGGLDLLALNVQRGRDHGLPSYNVARSRLGLTIKASFSEVTSDHRLANELKAIYDSIDKVSPSQIVPEGAF